MRLGVSYLTRQRHEPRIGTRSEFSRLGGGKRFVSVWIPFLYDGTNTYRLADLIPRTQVGTYR
jgi:hypothetical protein